MYRSSRSTALATCLLLTAYVLKVHSVQRQTYLNIVTGQQCQTVPIGESWLSASQVTCHSECLLQYPGTCQSTVYDPENNLCTPGATAFGPMGIIPTAIPLTSSNHKLLYTDQPAPPCDTAVFSLYEMCGTTLCLNLHTQQVDFFQARTNCAQENARPIVTDTLPKLAIFRKLSLANFNASTWVGLTDLVVEGTFVWENGELLTDELAEYLWNGISPDNSNGDEHCTEFRANSASHNFRYNDIYCTELKYYVCEQN